jgi:hypothetical protein
MYTRRHWTLGCVFVAVVLAAISIAAFAHAGESTTIVFIWLGSILALYCAHLPNPRHLRIHITREEGRHLAALAVLLIIGLFATATNITTLPYNLDGDFADVGLQARALVTGRQHNIFAYGWANVPILGYIPPWLTMSLFGTGLAGLNASGVAQGLLIVIGVYLLGRDLFHGRVGLFAAALLTISCTHIAASRQSSYIDPPFFLLFSVYFFLVGLRKGQWWAVVSSGVLSALCVQMYYSGRLVVFVVAVIILYLLLFRRQWLWKRAWAVVLWGLTMLVTLGPMIIVFLRETDGFISRTRDVFILTPAVVQHMQSVYGVDNVPSMLLQQARRTALIFNYYLDTSTQYGVGPFLDPLSSVLFVLGVGYALFRWRSISYMTILGWALLGLIVGCYLTVNPPFYPRLMILIPPTALLAAIALNRLYDLAHRGLSHIHRWVALLAPAIVVFLLVGVGILNWDKYVQLKGSYATPRARIGRYLAESASSTRAYLVSSDFTYVDREFQFLAPDRFVANLTPEQLDEEIERVGTPTLLIITPEQIAVLEQLERRFPGESVQTVIGNVDTEIAFYVFELP